MEQLPKSQCIIDQDGYATVTVAYGRYYVLLPQPAANLYPVRSDTTYPVGVNNGKTYTFGITVSGNAVPSLMVGNSGVFVSTVRRQGSKYYVTVKAVGAPGAMTAVYSTLPKQKPVILCYIAAEK